MWDEDEVKDASDSEQSPNSTTAALPAAAGSVDTAEKHGRLTADEAGANSLTHSGTVPTRCDVKPSKKCEDGQLRDAEVWHAGRQLFLPICIQFGPI